MIGDRKMYFNSERISLCKKWLLFFTLIFNTKKFISYEEEYKNVVKKKDECSDAYLIRNAFFVSLGLIILIILIGIIIGRVLYVLFGSTNEILEVILQIFGAILILHGALFLRGWEIQTMGVDTLSEKMNQWIYKLLISLGTFIIVMILSWGYF